MPIFPPWIRAAEPAQYYGQGYGLGLREWEQQAQDARAWNEMAMQGEAQAARQALAEQELGLREAEFGLSQEELGMRQQVEQRKAQEASQLYAARQEYQRRVQSGEDPIQVLMEMGPMMGSQQTAEAAAIRAMMQGQKQAPSQIMGIPLIDPATGKPIPGLMGAPTTGGGVTFHPQPGYAAAQTANRPPTLGALVNRERLMRQYQADINKIITEMPEVTEQAPPAAWNTRRKAEWKARRDAIDQIRAAMQRIPGGPTNAPGTPTMIYNQATGRAEPIGATSTSTNIPAGTAVSGLAPSWPQQEGEAPPAAGPGLPTTPGAFPMRTSIPRQPIGMEDIQSAIDDIENSGFTLAKKALKSPMGKALADIAEGTAGALDIPTAGLLNLYQRLNAVRQAVSQFGEPDQEVATGELPPEPVPTEAGDVFD